MATQAAILGDIRSRLDEPTSRFWSDEELRRWINEAARDIARRAEVLEASTTVSVVAGTNEYTLATDIIRVYRALWTPTGSTQNYPLDYQDFNSLDAAGWTFTVSQGYPAVYTLWGYPPSLKMILYPKPTVAGTITYYYYKLPTDLALDGSAAASTVTLPSGWEDLIALYVEYVAMRKDGNPRWQEAKSLYEMELGEMIDRTRRWTDQAGAIQQSGTYLPGWLWDPEF